MNPIHTIWIVRIFSWFSFLFVRCLFSHTSFSFSLSLEAFVITFVKWTFHWNRTKRVWIKNYMYNCVCVCALLWTFLPLEYFKLLTTRWHTPWIHFVYESIWVGLSKFVSNLIQTMDEIYLKILLSVLMTTTTKLGFLLIE